jgi:hypothetical protein
MAHACRWPDLISSDPGRGFEGAMKSLSRQALQGATASLVIASLSKFGVPLSFWRTSSTSSLNYATSLGSYLESVSLLGAAARGLDRLIASGALYRMLRSTH